jgi:hypothetical protein
LNEDAIGANVLRVNKEIWAELDRVLSKLSGHIIAEGDYVSYFVNEHGEQLIFVRKQDKGHAILLHSDLDWQPKLMQGPPTLGADAEDVPPDVRRFFGDVPVIGDVILNHSEALWLKACFAASRQW